MGTRLEINTLDQRRSTRSDTIDPVLKWPSPLISGKEKIGRVVEQFDGFSMSLLAGQEKVLCGGTPRSTIVRDEHFVKHALIDIIPDLAGYAEEP